MVPHDVKEMSDKALDVTQRYCYAGILAQSMTENEITQLGVDQSTISRDIKALKELSQQFVFNLTKSDLAYDYKQCIDWIEEVRRKGWDIFKNKYNNLTPKDKLLALKVIIRECNEWS